MGIRAEDRCDAEVGGRDESYSPLAYARARSRAMACAMAFEPRRITTATAFAEWQRGFRAAYAACLGKLPEPAGDLDVRVRDQVETPEYVRRTMDFQADAFSRIPAYLFLPKGGGPSRRYPAVLCCHGHGRGKDDVAGVATTDFEREHIAGYRYDYALQFARRGYVVLAPDLRCFGERTDSGEDVYGCVPAEEGDHWCDVHSVLLSLLGIPLAALHVFDMGRCVDLLLSLPETDGGRVGMMGLSQGGTTTLFAAAHDTRIRVAGISGYLNSWTAFPLASGQICGSQIVPGLRRYGDHAELAGLICPRPLFVEHGRQDPIFPIEATRGSVAKVRAMYRLHGSGAGGTVEGERFQFEEFDGVHQFHGGGMYEFFARWL